MRNPGMSFEKFFGVVGSGQAYLNLIYVLLAFPLGVFYFVYLVTGLATGLSLTIVWVGIPIILLVMGGWWLLAALERELAIHMLHEEVGPMSRHTKGEPGAWARFKDFIGNPVTWKSLAYLFAKFPLGVLFFVVVVTLGALTAALISAPLTYELGLIEFNLWYGVEAWRIDTLNEALILALVGLLMWPVSLHVVNGMAWASGRFAKLMLGVEAGRAVDIKESTTGEEDSE